MVTEEVGACGAKYTKMVLLLTNQRQGFNCTKNKVNFINEVDKIILYYNNRLDRNVKTCLIQEFSPK